MTNRKLGTPTQLEKFKELARESECDTDPVAFDQAIKGARGIKPPTKEEAFKAKREGEAD